MNKELQVLATEYAMLMQEYYELEVHCETSELRQDKLALRRKLDEMLVLHNQMANVARMFAEENR